MSDIDRFSDKAEIYEMYRPSYPKNSLLKILETCKIISNSNIKVADIGSGTGKFTELLLNAGFSVYAVEPNAQMRYIAENKFHNFSNFYSIDQTAESTGLDHNTISLITVAQAFHYFDLDQVKKEFKRILKLGGKVVLLWNFRLRKSKFIQEYEDMIYHFHSGHVNPTHAQDNMKDEVFSAFFTKYEILYLSNSQEFDFDGLWGRTLSNNHMPKENEPEYQKLKDNVKELFDKYKINGKVLFEYQTKIVIGDL